MINLVGGGVGEIIHKICSGSQFCEGISNVHCVTY